MRNLHLFSIKNKIDFESTPNLFEPGITYKCSFISDNKIVLFNQKDFFLNFNDLKNLNVQKEIVM